MGLSAALKSAAVARMAKGQDPLVRSPSSFIDTTTRWKNLQGLIARVIAANPDIVFYFKGVAASSALSSLLQVQAYATEALFLLSGTLQPQRPLNTMTLAALAKSGRAVEQAVTRGLDPSQSPWFSSAAWSTVMADLGSSLDAGGKTGPRGVEAETKLIKAIQNLQSAWDDYVKRYQVSIMMGIGSEEIVRSLAVQSSLAKTLTTLEMEPSAERQTEYVNQLMAGISAMKSMSQEFSFTSRFLIEDGTHKFPEGFRATPIVSNNMITGFSFTEVSTGLPVSPRLLNIDLGDVVSINTAFLGIGGNSVGSISSSGITINPVPQQDVVSLRIESLAGTALATLVRELSNAYPLAPSNSPTLKRVDYVDEFSQVIAEIQQLAQTRESTSILAYQLFRLVSSIDEPSPEVTAAYSRLSQIPAPNYPVKISLLFFLFSPAFILFSEESAQRRNAFKNGRAILRLLKSEGWIRAYDLLARSGSIVSLLTIDAEAATYEGTIASLQNGVRKSTEFTIAGVRS